MSPATTARPARSARRVRRSPPVATLLVVPALALAGCGGALDLTAATASGGRRSSGRQAGRGPGHGR